MKYLIAVILLTLSTCQPVYAASGQDVTNYAATLLHVREATGRNDGKMVTKIVNEGGGLDNEAQIKRTGSGYAWCLAFCIYCFRQVYHPSPFPRMARVQTFWEMAQDNELRYRTFRPDEGRALPGDIGCYAKHPEKRSWDGHAFLVEKQLGVASYKSLEGNTNGAGSREGNGVYRKIRYNTSGSLELQGFVRPR